MPTDRYRAATDHLAAVDPDWARLIALIGPCTFAPKPAREPYQALVRAVAYQQLATRAGDTIFGRFLNLYPDDTFPSPERILSTETAALRACGFSARKAETICGIAEAALSGVVPARAEAERMDDEALIARLTPLRGIGRWTVEMLLIFTLERMDILPLDDFGVREGYRWLKGLDALPDRKQLAAAGAPWSPYRSIASWYFWRALAHPAYRRRGALAAT